MQIRKKLKVLARQRILIITAGSLSGWLVLLLLYYSLFLLLPAQFIRAGLISPYGLLISFIVLLAISAFPYIYRLPFTGKRFLQEIIIHPYSATDLNAALEIELGKSYPGSAHKSRRKNKTAKALSDHYISNIAKHIMPPERFGSIIIPDTGRAVFCAVIIIVSVILSAVKAGLIVDVIIALKSGLPAELISVGTPLKFEKLEAVILPPAYLGSVTEGISLNLNKNKKIKVIRGSGIFLKGITSADGLESGRLMLSSGGGVEYFPVTVKDRRNFESSFLAPDKGAFALEMTFTDENNKYLSGKSKIFLLEAMPDQPPAIKILFPPEDHNLVFGNPVDISFSASDDYGILEILLYHRDPESGSGYNKEIIARFPKEARTEYTTTYSWNPVIREGDKINELVYQPSTKSVEYFLEVRDINSFSSGGITRSSIRHMHFTDMYSGLKTAIGIIQELVTEGRKLLTGSSKSNVESYKKKLNHALNVFSKDLMETLPQSNLIKRTGEILADLTVRKQEEIKKPLKSYVEYLERFLVFMNLILETETGKAVDNELSKLDASGRSLDNTLRRTGPLAEMLEKEFRREIEEINKLIEKGEMEKARRKLSELIEKIRRRIASDLEKSKAMSQKIAEEVKKILQDLNKQAGELLKSQEQNKFITEKQKIKNAKSKQKEINNGLSDLHAKTGKLSSEYPFMMYSLDSYAGAARANGERALQSLDDPRPDKSLNYQGQVIRLLKAFLESSSKQMQLMEDIARGNFEQLTSGGYSGRFVLIPKEAAYTIPIDYKNKVIEMSRDRSNTTKEKEDFWREILE